MRVEKRVKIFINFENHKYSGTSLMVYLMILLILIIYPSALQSIQEPEQSNLKIIKMTEVLKIVEYQDAKFYFKSPWLIRVSSSGDIYVKDHKELLKFSSKGTFLENFYKHGQGPGEVTFIRNFIVNDQKIIIFDSGQRKVVILSSVGKILEEFKIHSNAYLDFYTALDHDYFFFRTEPPDTKAKLRFIDINNILFSINPKENREKNWFNFPIKYLILSQGDKKYTMPTGKFRCTYPYKKKFFVTHKSEYEIKLCDLETGIISKLDKKEYKRILVNKDNQKYTYGGNKISIGNNQFFKVPRPKYLNDIQMMFRFKEKLLVVTSDVKNKKYVLVDVYNWDGIFIKSCLIKCPPKVEPYWISLWLKFSFKDFLFALEFDENDHYVIKKYRVNI